MWYSYRDVNPEHASISLVLHACPHLGLSGSTLAGCVVFEQYNSTSKKGLLKRTSQQDPPQTTNGAWATHSLVSFKIQK
jgi:hypothetical protein